ncbi:hypothetical protein PL81_22250, partial [Streptomyces sp. RSD-27]
DFADLVRIRAVLRAGTLHERSALEASFPEPPAPAAGAPSPAAWHPVRHQMQRDACCNAPSLGGG